MSDEQEIITSMPEDEPLFGIPPDLVKGPEADVLPLAGEANWGMATFQIEKIRSITTGEDIIVGVVDTGVDRDHPLLTNVIDARDFTGSPASYHDRQGHGTHCSGTVGASDLRIGAAPGCKIVHGKGLGDSGSGAMSWLIRAMDWCVEQGATILSCSWGGGTLDPQTDSVLKRFAEAGIWPVFAGGNSGPNTRNADAPGVSQYAINVAALNRDLSPANFSSAGEKLDTSGPGVNIWSTKPGGGYQLMSGTSMATPFVAGLLALYRSALVKKGKPIPKVSDLRRTLFGRSTDTHTPGDDRRTGPGWVTPLLLSLDLAPDPPQIEN